MQMFALIALSLFIVLVVGGVFVNVFLYTRGAVGKHDRMSEMASVTLSQEASADAEDLYYLGIGSTDHTMSNYMRKTLAVFAAAILAVCLIGAFLLNLIVR
ncbi:hypothetical protein [Ktedonospora formicarum]|uniref:Uncharacterized protein n=1 Tax=Ktedonospora formicarum TaxID=2778364 RepID=A0A8J3HRT5_9CHLR|nr:hypothetical protein [Ktedonospora formicarum]GHO42737.1 hypothetical protein KSX_09000 [Ktedonospora formicarum]